MTESFDAAELMDELREDVEFLVETLEHLQEAPKLIASIRSAAEGFNPMSIDRCDQPPEVWIGCF